jgi:hypothetical protein
MKVLITGSTAQQASQKTAQRIPTFASMMATELAKRVEVVDFVEPSIEFTKEYLSQYDVVLVGIAPPTSLSANKVYPAFVVGNRAKELGNLAIFIDAPEPYKLQASLKSCHLRLSDLQKDFYKRRKNYKDITENKELADEMYSFIDYLCNKEWPITLYPSLPWSEPSAITSAIPNILDSRLFGFNFDYQIIEQSNKMPSYEQGSRGGWVADSPNTKWTKSLALTLHNPVTPARVSRWEAQEETDVRIASSLGALISVYRSNEPWWSPFVAKTLAANKPVVTDWRYSSKLGTYWSYLGSTIEEMTPEERSQLAVKQKLAYLDYITKSKADLVETLELASSKATFANN